MAACEEPVSLLIGTEGAGLYNCITADLEVPPPSSCFFAESSFAENHKETSLLFSFSSVLLF